jgi:hypothetical protein
MRSYQQLRVIVPWLGDTGLWKHFLISYARPDVTTASWVVEELRELGYDSIIQARDFGPDHAMRNVRLGLSQSMVLIAILSKWYFQSDYAPFELAWAETHPGMRTIVIFLEPMPSHEANTRSFQIPFYKLKTSEARRLALLDAANRFIHGV